MPTALDRVIQQALSQVLVPVFDPGFSERSFGFRPGRSTHQTIKRAQRDIAEGHEQAVDLDLDRFFDRVQHDALMARVARQVTDKKVLKLIRTSLEAGVMADGVKQPSEEGTPPCGVPSSVGCFTLSAIPAASWQRIEGTNGSVNPGLSLGVDR